MLARKNFKKISFIIDNISSLVSFRIIVNYSTSSPSISSNPNYKISKFLVYCNSQISKNGRLGNIKEAESIFNRMPTKNIVSWTAMLTAYAEAGDIGKSRKLFDEMTERSVASWNAMITAYVRSRNGIDEAIELFGRMPERNAVSYAAMITGYIRAGRLSNAEKLYHGMPLDMRDPVCSNVLISGYLKVDKLEEAIQVFERMKEKDVVSWSSMIDGYCKKGRVCEARELFRVTQERNVVTWTAMIDGCVKMGSFEDGFGLFIQMRREDGVDIAPNTLSVIFEGCGKFGRLREGCQVHGLAVLVGFSFDSFLGNSVITMYSRLGYVDAAYRLFHVMDKKDVISWNSLISGCVQAEKIEDAYRLFEEMPLKDVVSWTTMISGFSSKGLTEKAVELFSMMPEKDDVAWTALISGFATNGQYEEAISWFIQMIREAVRPNPLTLSSVISSSAGLATLSHGVQIHSHVLKMDIEFDLSVQNSLVSMYSKCGNVGDAYKIFQTIRTPNVVSFNSMITGFAQNGFGVEAVELFKKMLDIGQEPNEITFLGVISACTHAGMVEEGWKYFKSMRSIYKIEPGPDHYACMVDLLGRAGLLNEAVNLINSMPINPHSGVWGALLSSSRTHLRLDIAKVAAQGISELEPNNATPYVVLSDLYLVLGEKRGEEQVRITKKTKGIKKSPGCSWVTVRDNVQTFLSGDQTHADFEDIKSTLRIIVHEMKQLYSYLE